MRPLRALCLGPRTELAGLTATTWPITSQSKRWRSAASFCLTVGAETFRPRASIQVATWSGSTAASERTPCASHQARNSRHGAPVGFAGIAVADVGGEEIDEAARCMLAAGGDQRGYIPRGSTGGASWFINDPTRRSGSFDRLPAASIRVLSP